MCEEELFGDALPEEEFVPSLCLEEPEFSIGLMSHEPDCSGCRNTPMEAACAMALVYSLDEVDVDVFMVDVAVTESGVASFGGVGGNVNMGCEDEPECWCSDLLVMGSSAEAPLNAEHQLLPNELACGDCLLSDDETEVLLSHGCSELWCGK